ncbi:MAG: hypothetical protein NTU94_09295 [Planctomycetota bacterium]|nr:hypothetical protein [Planctomycetota bacterium]
MRRIVLIAALAAVSGLAGCLARTMNLPADFVKVEQPYGGPYAVRGISADGVMIALRFERNPQNGTLAFWTEAMTNQVVSGRGYKAAGSEDVASAAKVPGRLLTFTAQKQGVGFTYVLVVFVQGSDILIGEAGGRTDAVEPKLAEIKKALLTAR